jgi:hypothetical protein
MGLAIMPVKPRQPTTPEEEGIELVPDSWERFKRTATEVGHYRPDRAAAKQAAANQPQKKRSRRAKPNR